MSSLSPAALALIALALASPFGDPPKAESAQEKPEPSTTESEVIARVNGEPVLAEDVAARLGAMHQEATEGARTDFDLDRLVDRVVNDVLLAQEARALGLDAQPRVQDEVVEFRNKQVLRLLEEIEIREKSIPTENEVREVFDDQYQRVDLRMVSAYEEAAARDMLARLREGADMAELARAESVDSYANRAGLAADIERTDIKPEIADVAFSLEPGTLAGPIRTDLGWSVIRPEAFRPADPARFPELEGFCRRTATFLKAKALREALTRDISGRLKVDLDEAVASRIEPEALPDGRFMPKVPDKSAVVARIGPEVTLTAGEYSQALVGRWKGVRNIEAARAAAPIILNTLLEQKLLLAEALRREYDEDPRVVRRVRAFENQKLIPVFLEEMISGKVEVTPEKMKAYYEANKEGFHRPPRLRLSQITVESLDEAGDVVRLLRQGTDMSWLAEKRSTDGYAESGGDRGWFSPTPGVDEFNDQLMKAEVGEVLNPYGVPGNFVIVKVTAREEQGIYEYDEMSGNLRKMVFEDELRREVVSFMEKLRSRAEIEINRDALARLAITGAPASPAGEAEHGGGSHGS
jgi:peptidyl-prolyl cis-trans isomerase C